MRFIAKKIASPSGVAWRKRTLDYGRRNYRGGLGADDFELTEFTGAYPGRGTVVETDAKDLASDFGDGSPIVAI